jgi:hypothetical protein
MVVLAPYTNRWPRPANFMRLLDGNDSVRLGRF